MVPLFLAMILLLVPDLIGAAEPAEGDREQGRRLFEEKGCIQCHVPPGKPKDIGPPLATLQRRQGLLQLAGRLWNHVPAMQQEFTERGKAWPTLSKEEMADLAAFLLARPGADPPGSEARGQVLLLKKGCLKCHAFFGEGAGVGPDLSRSTVYDSPLDWATGVWDHAPKMRAKAEQLGTEYPRFEADEMVDLVAFLKASADRNKGTR
jgi:mono/diheme cytochrome c family protein